MTKAEILSTLADSEVVGLTIWAEARSESIDGQVAVGNVLRNRFLAKRATAWGTGWKGVCTHRLQFSCWNTGTDKNHVLLMKEAKSLAAGNRPTDKKLLTTLHIAEGILLDVFPDLSRGATHYYSPKGMVPPGSHPVWSRPPAKLTVVIGNHRFYSGVA